MKKNFFKNICAMFKKVEKTEISLDDQLVAAVENRDIDEIIRLISAGADVNCQVSETRIETVDLDFCYDDTV